MPSLVAVARNPSGNAHNPFLYAGDRRRALFRRECATGLSGELVVLGAAVEVGLELQSGVKKRARTRPGSRPAVVFKKGEGPLVGVEHQMLNP
jgi:hypothetical protein